MTDYFKNISRLLMSLHIHVQSPNAPLKCFSLHLEGVAYLTFQAQIGFEMY